MSRFAAFLTTFAHVSGFHDTLLNSWPMIMAHDAATGYLLSELNPVYAWARTQHASSTAFTVQLDCGVRAFDMRGFVNKDGKFEFHHGTVEVDKDVDEALAEIVSWSNANPGLEDLIFVNSVDCDGCGTRMDEALAKAGIYSLKDCGVLNNLTLGSAGDLGKLSGGGHVLAVANESCVAQNYNPSLACSGFDEALCPDIAALSADELGKSNHAVNRCMGQLRETMANSNQAAPNAYYDCWTGGSGRDFAINRLFQVLRAQAAVPPSLGDRPSQLQALWQETTSSVVIGTMRFSSLLTDEAKSGLNQAVIADLQAGHLPYVNLLEINNACDGGPDMLKTLRQRLLKHAEILV